jgi:cytochrome d ubiquinol oxidase subunit I
VYAVALLRGKTSRYYRLGFLIPFTVACIAVPLQMVVGDELARYVYNNEPAKFAAIELVPQTKSDVPETLLGHENSNGTVSGGLPIPGLASWLSDPATGTSTVVQGRNAFPTSQEPTIGETNIVHLGWDLMVGIGTLLTLLAVWFGITWLFKRRYPKMKLFLWIAAASGVLSIIALEAGWVVTEVGRQPWIVHNYMTVTQGATTNGGVWLTFLIICAIYLAVGVGLIWVMRRMSRGDGETGIDPHDVPYGPPEPLKREEVPVG